MYVCVCKHKGIVGLDNTFRKLCCHVSKKSTHLVQVISISQTKLIERVILAKIKT